MRGKMLLASVLAVVVMQSGCGTYSAYRSSPKVVNETVTDNYFPIIGMAKTKEVGITLVEALTRTTVSTYTVPQIKLLKPIGAELSGMAGARSIDLPSGAVLEQRASDARATYWVSDKASEGRFPTLMFVRGRADQVKACLQTPVRHVDSYSCAAWKALVEGVDFEKSERTFDKTDIDAPSPKKELIFQGGVDGREVKMLYREFTRDNLARPAFSQNLSYDISKDRVIGFQSLRIEVLEITPTSIRYRVLKHFD